MLKLLRKKGLAKKIIWIIAIVIIFSFGFFGTAYLITGNTGSDYAGRIFGKKVTIEDFGKFYRNTRLQAVRQYGNNLQKIAHMLNLEAQTWDRMILLHEAKRRRIRISNEDIVRNIQEDTSFERDGRFDMLLYNAILRSLQIRPRDYEEHVRDNLKIAELYRQATSTVTISEEEVFDAYKKRNEKVQVSYVYVPFEGFVENILINDGEVKKYYEENKDEFLLPPSVNVQYLSFDFPETVIETEDGNEIEDDALEEEKDKIRDKAQQVFDSLLIDPDMAKIAGQFGLTVKTTGFFSMEQPNLALGWSYELLNGVFQMNESEVREPFENPSGMTIIQVKEKRDAQIPEFTETEEKAREAVINQKSKEIARKKADEYLVAIRSELEKSKIMDFTKAAKAIGLEIHQTPEFTRGQYLPQVGLSTDFQDAAFKLNDVDGGEVSNVIETDKGFCLLHLDDYTPIDESAYEEAKDDLAQSISDEKKSAAFADFLAQLRLEADVINNLAQLETVGP